MRARELEAARAGEGDGMITLYAVEDTIPPRIITREARETPKLYIVRDHFGLRTPAGISFKNRIGRKEFEGAAGCGLSPIEAADSWIEYRKRRLEAVKQAAGQQRAAVNAALKLRNELEAARAGKGEDDA